MSIVLWIKQTLCWHDWDCQGNPMQRGYVPWFRCTKCGKEEGLKKHWWFL